MKAICTIVAGFLCSATSHAATGVFGSYIGVNNGGGNVWYGAQEWGANDLTNFGGLNLGTFNPGNNLQISAFEVDTFKSGSGDVTGVELQYRVFRQGDTPGAFNAVGGGFLSNATFTSAAGNNATGGGDQKWGVNPTATLGNLLAGVTQNGSYSVEVFFRAFTNEGDRFSNNGGNNYIANFTVIPEPTGALLGVLCVMGLLRRRRA